MAVDEQLAALVRRIRGCRICVEQPRGAPLPHQPRPVLRISSTARLCLCSQAPGTRVHASGTPFTDPSGDRLRDWMGVTPEQFYDPRRLAIAPMGFCFPGLDASGGDLPPRRECAPAWREKLFEALPQWCLRQRILLHAERGRLRHRLRVLRRHLHQSGGRDGRSLRSTQSSWRNGLHRRRPGVWWNDIRWRRDAGRWRAFMRR